MPTQLEGLTWANTQTGQSADLSLATDGLPAAYTDSSGMEARFSDYQLSDAASSVTVSFFRKRRRPGQSGDRADRLRLVARATDHGRASALGGYKARQPAPAGRWRPR